MLCDRPVDLLGELRSCSVAGTVRMVSAEDSKMADSRDMIAVHDAFRAHFGVLPRLVREVRSDNVMRAKVVSEHAVFLSEMVNAHHSGEDEHVWPRLHQRIPAEAQRLVDRMEAQHGQIDEGLGELVAGCRRWASSGDTADRDASASAAERVDRVLHDHLALEEAEAMPLIDGFLTQMEWQATIAAGAAKLTPAQGALMLGMVLASSSGKMQALLQAGASEQFWREVRPAALEVWGAHAKQVYGDINSYVKPPIA
jgi:hemerythrin-like domain-containing protein